MDPGGTGIALSCTMSLCHPHCIEDIQYQRQLHISISCPPGGKNRLLRKLEFEGRLGHACSAYLSSAGSRIESATKDFCPEQG